MSTRKRITWSRLLLAGVAVGTLLVLRGPLMHWFSLDTVPTMSSSASQHNYAHDDSGGLASRHTTLIPLHTFSSNELSVLRDIFAATEEIRVALSQDRTDTVPTLATRIQSDLEGLHGALVPGPVRDAISQTSTNASFVAESNSAATMRTTYAKLSEDLFRLAQADPRLQKGWRVFSCPMVESFPKWFQAPEQIENPYMGQKMLACGSSSDWSTTVESVAPPTVAEVAHYTCSMHPSVRQQRSSACPICNMDLVPVTQEDLRTGDVLVDTIRRQRIGVRTQVVTTRSLVRSIRAVGEVAWDESRVYDVTARVDGWVEDLRVTRAGDPVERKAKLLRFYSPDLVTTQRELLNAPSGGRLAESARERLRRWGMSTRAIRGVLRRGQPQERVSIQSPIGGVVIEKRVNEGAHVSAGALLYRIADPSRVWVLADVFEQDLLHVAIGQGVQVTLPHAPEQFRTDEVAYIYPTLSASTRTAKVRIELDNSDGALRPGMFANVTFDVNLGEHLAVSADALIHTGPRHLVFVDKGEGRLQPVEVQIGARTGEWIIIKQGLTDGDIVVTSGAFLLAAESRIRSATHYWEVSDEVQE